MVHSSPFRMWMLVIAAVGLVVSLATADTVMSPPTIQLEKAVHFTAPNGDPVTVGPGTFDVEAMKDGLKLTPKGGKESDAVIVQAMPMPHGEALTAPKAQSEPGIGPDEHRIALLLPDNQGFEARGSYSGIRSRGLIGTNAYYGVDKLPATNTGTFNSAFGVGTLAANTTGAYNTATGASALQANMTGANNTATGFQTLQANINGHSNTASGANALFANTTGSSNTASGANALYSNTAGNSNIANGSYALYSNTTGSSNTAFGSSSLERNTTGSFNTALGHMSLRVNTTGNTNTASGANALYSNTTGNNNTANGIYALRSNTTGNSNTAMGTSALQSNTIGVNNTAVGFEALKVNVNSAVSAAGANNTAVGASALGSNTTGNENTAMGISALFKNSTGAFNTAIGYLAGYAQTTGSHNVYVSNPGAEGENGTTRIGTPLNQTRAFVAGISGVAVSGTPVVVNTTGQLGVQASSLRYKDDVQSMGEASRALQKLRPVTFKYKADVAGAGDDQSREYGLIAEEVAEVYPELVGRDAHGMIVTVKYHELIPMLLNELQKEHRENRKQRQEIDGLKAQVAELRVK